MTASQSTRPAPSASSNPLKVMVVDDSAVIRGFITRFLEQDPAIKVVGSASNGEMAVRNLALYKPDVVLLDIEMPVMDGMTALPKLLEVMPDVQIVMASTLTLNNAEISLRALQQGAVDYVPKPESKSEVNSNIDFRKEITEKVRAYGAARRKARGEPLPGDGFTPSSFQGRRPVAFNRSSSAPTGTAVRQQAHQPVQTAAADTSKQIMPRQASRHKPDILVIGASTGGPQALISLFQSLGASSTHIPVLIVQHMPATFTSILANHLGKAAGRPAQEGQDGLPIKPGAIYVAPGNYHMLLGEKDGAPVLRINQDPPENYCRPAVDPLFRSVAAHYGPRTLGAILTGMGHDGLKGGRDIVSAGGTLIAQDEESSVVWGMPGAVANAGLCHKVLPLSGIADALSHLLKGTAS